MHNLTKEEPGKNFENAEASKPRIGLINFIGSGFDLISNRLKVSKCVKLWDKIYYPFANEDGFKDLLINQRELHTGQSAQPQDLISPQAMQGRWQAYGQIRAARIIGRSSVLVTGFIGAGLFMYRQILERDNENEKKQLEIQKNQLNEQKIKLDRLEKELNTDLRIVNVLHLDVEKDKEIIGKASSLLKEADSIVPTTEKKGFHLQFNQFIDQKNREYDKKIEETNLIRNNSKELKINKIEAAANTKLN